MTVTNAGAETLEITALDDNIYGDLNGRGDCSVGAILATGNSYRAGTEGHCPAIPAHGSASVRRGPVLP